MMKTKIILLLFLLPAFIFSGTDGSEKASEQSDTLLIQHIFPYQQQHCHGSTIVELPNKDLLVAWFQGSGERTSDDVTIEGARYNHNTKKWGEPFVMADVPDFPDINPVLFIDTESRLWLTWYTVMAYQWSTSLLKYRISENYQQKEGAPEWKWQDVIHVKADGQPTEGIGENDPFVKTLEKKFDDYFEYLQKSGQVGENGIPEERLEMARNLFLDIAKGKNLVSSGTEVNENGDKIKK